MAEPWSIRLRLITCRLVSDCSVVVAVQVWSQMQMHNLAIDLEREERKPRIREQIKLTLPHFQITRPQEITTPKGKLVLTGYGWVSSSLDSRGLGGSNSAHESPRPGLEPLHTARTYVRTSVRARLMPCSGQNASVLHSSCRLLLVVVVGCHCWLSLPLVVVVMVVVGGCCY